MLCSLRTVEARLTMVQWTLGIGFTVVVALQLFVGGLPWQIFQRLTK